MNRNHDNRQERSRLGRDWFDMMDQTPKPTTSVLIAEDELLVRLHTAEVLKEHGLDTLEAGSAARALSLLEAGLRVDVLFTDVNMPGALDGLDLARLVRARWPQTVILITSGRHRPDMDHALARFVPKPYCPDHVAQSICSMICQPTSLASRAG